MYVDDTTLLLPFIKSEYIISHTILNYPEIVTDKLEPINLQINKLKTFIILLEDKTVSTEETVKDIIYIAGF